MRIAETLIRRLIREAIEAETEEQVEAELIIEPTPDCVTSHFDEFQNLGQAEQQAYYNAFDTCVDRSIVNTSALDVIHWFNFYEGSQVKLLNDFIEWIKETNLKLTGAFSAVGYANFAVQKSTSKTGKIGLVLDGPISLAFFRDAETERGGIFKTKMPGKLSGGQSSDPAHYIKYMILGEETYDMPNDPLSSNEFIMINPGVKRIIIDTTWFTKDTERFGVSSKGVSIKKLLAQLAESLLVKNIPIVDMEGNDAKPVLESFLPTIGTDADATLTDEIIATLTGKKEMTDQSMSGPSTIDLLKNFSSVNKLPNQYPGNEYFVGLPLQNIMNKLNDQGKLRQLIGPKRSEPVVTGLDTQPIPAKFIYYNSAGDIKLTPMDLIRRFIEGKPIYFQKIIPYFKNPKHRDHSKYQWLVDNMPWLENVQEFVRWLDMKDYGGDYPNSPIEDTLIPFIGAVEYDNFLEKPFPVPPPIPLKPKFKYVAKLEDGSTIEIAKKAGDFWTMGFEKLLEDAESLTTQLTMA